MSEENKPERFRILHKLPDGTWEHVTSIAEDYVQNQRKLTKERWRWEDSWMDL
jgi:hypothetical protein